MQEVTCKEIRKDAWKKFHQLEISPIQRKSRTKLSHGHYVLLSYRIGSTDTWSTDVASNIQPHGPLQLHSPSPLICPLWQYTFSLCSELCQRTPRTSNGKNPPHLFLVGKGANNDQTGRQKNKWMYMERVKTRQKFERGLNKQVSD